ncbi:MAG: methyl-accepting chemotaxis protein [Gammaproteobacteria bacterium]|nr:methyl-accepting chemotaxis protein [Gammaproteobacteria bacterium]
MAIDVKKIKSKFPVSAGSGVRGARNIALFVLLILSLVATVIIFRQVLINETYRAEYVSLTDQLRLVSQQMPGLAIEAASGNAEAFGALEEKVDEFSLALKKIREGNAATGLPASPQDVDAQVSAVVNAWENLKKNAGLVVDSTEEMLTIQEDADGFRLASPELQAMVDEVLGLMVEANEPAQQVYFASLQLTYSERMAARLQEALQGNVGSATAANDFAKWTQAFRSSLNIMRGVEQDESALPVKDEAAKALLEEVDAVFTAHEDNVEAIMDGISRFFQVREAAGQIFEESQTLLSRLDDLSTAYKGRGETGLYTTQNGYIVGSSVIVLLILLGVLMLIDSRRRTKEATLREEESLQQTQTQNMAVLQLLDEIEPLQDGDLTVEASVDEAFTGTIADAINSSIDVLRTLVSTINEASSQVSSAAQETMETTTALAEASNQQAKDIASATESVSRMAESMQGVSAEAGRSAEVAKNSVDIAHKGGETVRATIGGMDSIREQIQETSKRLKRLGESSQEIGDIVGLINDIADQTNILALNAAIQASSAGEAGRGFAVVADEVQRLAERSTNATRQIENLVTAIQADTNEAVISMEQTTTEVVEGAKRAENAGEALDEIEKVSSELAELIDKISVTANQHAQGAAKISSSMLVIEGVTRETSEGTSQTAESIGNLASMADNLKQQVSGFRLPE